MLRIEAVFHSPRLDSQPGVVLLMGGTDERELRCLAMSTVTESVSERQPEEERIIDHEYQGIAIIR
jgi:hypothetical protein